MSKTDQEKKSKNFMADKKLPSNTRKDKRIQERFDMGVLTDLDSVREPKKESQIPQYISKNHRTFALNPEEKKYKGKKTADKFYYGIYI